MKEDPSVVSVDLSDNDDTTRGSAIASIHRTPLRAYYTLVFVVKYIVQGLLTCYLIAAAGWPDDPSHTLIYLSTLLLIPAGIAVAVLYALARKPRHRQAAYLVMVVAQAFQAFAFLYTLVVGVASDGSPQLVWVTAGFASAHVAVTAGHMIVAQWPEPVSDVEVD